MRTWSRHVRFRLLPFRTRQRTTLIAEVESTEQPLCTPAFIRRPWALPHPLHNLSNVHRPRGAILLFPLLEAHHSWQAANTILGSELLRRLGIYLRKAHIGFHAFRGLSKRGRHHPAGATPARPKIDNNWDISVANKLSEGLLIECHWSRSKERLAAFTTGWPLPKTLGRNTVGSQTVRA